MSLRDAITAAAKKNRIVKFQQGSKLVAIICLTCRYGDGLFDQDPESYANDPYGCDPETCPHNVTARSGRLAG